MSLQKLGSTLVLFMDISTKVDPNFCKDTVASHLQNLFTVRSWK